MMAGGQLLLSWMRTSLFFKRMKPGTERTERIEELNDSFSEKGNWIINVEQFTNYWTFLKMDIT